MSVRGSEINRDVINILGVEFFRINDEDAQNFWKSLHDGVYEDDDDPVKRLRERLVKNGLSKTNKIEKLWRTLSKRNLQQGESINN